MQTIDKLSSFYMFYFIFVRKKSDPILFPVLFRLGKGAFCWTKEDREAMTDVSIVLAADGKGKACPNVIDQERMSSVEEPFLVNYGTLLKSVQILFLCAW